MKYTTGIQSAATNPVHLESLYQAARQSNDEAEFRQDMQSAFDASPDNLLYSAWLARFEHLPLPKTRRTTNWGLALVLGIITGLSLWAISDFQLRLLDQIDYFTLYWAPIATIPVLLFLLIISKRNYVYAAISAITLAIASVYILLIAPTQARLASRDYLILMVITLPLLCWMALGITTFKFKSSVNNRFAFLTKSIEVAITAGIYLIFGVIFGAITLGLFAALNITPPQLVLRLIGAGGFGLIPIMAVATMYDPLHLPEAQDFSQGLSRFIFIMMRLLLPLTIIVLVIYLFFIPFNFLAPFQNRNLLIIYNVMQFAIIGLLIGVTPLKVDDLSLKLQAWIKRGILIVSILALLISLYALSAVAYRTVMDGLTINRTTIIGWNVINIAVLVALVIVQLKKGLEGWHQRLQQVFSKTATAYLIWALFLVVALPLIFR